MTALKSPVTSNVDLGVDPKNPDHLRLGDSTGQLWESYDAGAT